MKNLRKSMSVILILLVSLFCFSNVAFASTSEQDGLKVELTTDKENYSLNEDIKINVTVTNTNDVTVENVKIDTLLPEEFTLKDKNKSTSSEAVDIPAGKKIELSVIAVVKDGKSDKTSSDTDSSLTKKPDNNDSKVQAVQATDNKSDTNKKDTGNKINGNDKSPYTGKDYAVMTGFSALFIIGIVLLILCLKRNKKKTSKAVSSALCLVLAITSIIGLADFKAKAENKQSDTDSLVAETNTDTSSVISISENISVDGKDFTIETNVSYNIEINKKIKEDIKEMSEVDNAISDLMNSDSYKNIVNNEEKVKIVEDLLIDLSRNGTDKMSKPLIQEDTITYYKETNQFGFIYSCGVSGGIWLSSFNDMMASNGSKSKNVTNIKNEVSNNNNHNSVLMYGWDNSSQQDSLFNEWNDYAKNISNRGLETKVYNCPTIMDYKTAFLEMDFICICEHGGFDSQTNTSCFLVQGEKYSILKDMNYIFDIFEDNILRRNVNGSNAYLITPKFFKSYYNGKLNGAIVILASCMGFGSNDVYDYSFAKAFRNDCGADVILGYHNSVFLAYDLVIAEDFTQNLLFGYTAKDAFNLALEKNENCDNDYMYKYMPNINPTWWNNPDKKNNMKTGKEQVDEKVAAIPILYGDKEKKLKLNRGNVCGIVKDSTTNNPIKDVEIEVINNSSANFNPITTTKTNENGNFNFNLPYGSYSISFNHSDYNYYGTSITIDCETVVLTEPVLLTQRENGITGYVYDNDDFINNAKNTPISDVIIEVYKDNNLIGKTTTDKNGKYSISIDKNGSYDLLFKKSGYNDEKKTLTDVNGGFANVNAYLQSKKTIVNGTLIEYNGHYYQVFDKGLNWNDAKAYCESVGGHLVTITSENEQQFVKSILSKTQTYNWLGGYKNNGKWEWITSEEWDYTNWGIGEPNNYLNRGENCLLMIDNGTWNDQLSTGDTTGIGLEDISFICEWESKDDIHYNGTPITKMKIIDHGHYMDNMADSRLNILGEEYEFGYGNLGVDGTVYQNGLEAWIARWNFKPEISWVYNTYELNEHYSKLTGNTSLIKSYNTTNFNTTLYIYGDNKLIYSQVLTNDSYNYNFDIDITGIKEVKIMLKDNIAVKGGTSFAIYDMFLN